MLWLDPPSLHASEVRRLVKATQLSPLFAQILGCRLQPFESQLEETEFLNPSLGLMTDPFKVCHLEAAAQRIVDALENKETICIVGDYDVDGISSTSLLVSILRNLGGDPLFAVPRRQEEGYGLSPEIIERLFSEAGNTPDLFIALDCGTNSIDEVLKLKSLGVDVIIVDHHQGTAEKTADALLVNPHIFDSEDAPWRNACTVGLVFKLCHGILKLKREKGDDVAFRIKLKEYLDLVALGTVADLVPLLYENRIWVKLGLELLRKTKRPGLLCLMEIAGIDTNRTLETSDISFKLGPRINACGRLDDAKTPIMLMLSDDYQYCREIAAELNSLNRQRQTIEKRMAESAELMVKENGGPADGIVVFDESWHSGVVGIVASRMMRAFNRPSIVLGKEGDLAKGSGRSIPGIDLVEVLAACDHLLESWGGHPMAVGVSVPIENIPEFERVFAESISQLCQGELPEEPLQIDGWLPQYCDFTKLLKEQEILSPFGMANPEPVFGVKEFHLDAPPQTFGQGHIRFFLNGYGRGINVIGWNREKNPPPCGRPLDLAIKLSWNYWNGRQIPQAELVDWRISP